jgi:hypothetical protein
MSEYRGTLPGGVIAGTVNAAPVAEGVALPPLDAEGLPPLPKPAHEMWDDFRMRMMATDAFTAEQVRQAQREAKALGYALGRGSAVRDYVCLNDAALAADRALPPKQSVGDDPEFKKLMAEYGFAGRVADHDHNAETVAAMIAKYHALIAYIDGRTAGATWVSVEDRLPEHGEEDAARVWASWNGAPGFPCSPRQGEARYIKSLGWQPDGCTGWDWIVTHWMPLPAAPSPLPPKEEDK